MSLASLWIPFSHVSCGFALFISVVLSRQPTSFSVDSFLFLKKKKKEAKNTKSISRFFFSPVVSTQREETYQRGGGPNCFPYPFPHGLVVFSASVFTSDSFGQGRAGCTCVVTAGRWVFVNTF